MKKRIITSIGATLIGLAALTACGAASDSTSVAAPATLTSAPAAATTSTATTAKPTPTTTAIPTPLPDTTAADTAACAAFGEEDFRTGFGTSIKLASAGTLPTYLKNTSLGYRPVSTLAPSSTIGTAVSSFNTAVLKLGTPGSVITDANAKAFVTAYNSIVTACTSAGYSITPSPGSVVFDCTLKGSTANNPKGVMVNTYQEVWPNADQTTSVVGGLCTTKLAVPYSEIQTAALAAFKASGGSASGDDYELRKFYDICMNPKSSGPYYQDASSWSAKGEVADARGALILCPDHPNAAEIQRKVDTAQSNMDGRAAGEIVDEGKFLVGKDIQPGTWQTKSDSVTDCYWEISDAQGDIIDNNFISIAPQFTIEIPSSAAGFTNQGCGTLVRIG
jgi:hypothetical protein